MIPLGELVKLEAVLAFSFHVHTCGKLAYDAFVASDGANVQAVQYKLVVAVPAVVAA